MISVEAMRAVVMASGMTCLVATASWAEETGDLSALRQEALEAVNAARAEAGLDALALSAPLEDAAQSHAKDMLARAFHDHITPEGETPHDRFLAAGGDSWAVSGENIATCDGCRAPADAGRVGAFHDGWMQSPSHRENILSRGFDSFGFGIAGEGRRIYAVQTFSGPGDNQAGDDDALDSPEAAGEMAQDHINAARAGQGLDPLERDEALDTVAWRVLEQIAESPDALPENAFALLPEESTGWTSLALQAATLGGAGVTLHREDLAAIISDWATTSEAEQTFGGMTASHLGFAAEAAGDGRVSAVAVFAGR